MATPQFKVSYVVRSTRKTDPNYGFIQDKMKKFDTISAAITFARRLVAIEVDASVIGKPCIEEV